MDILIFILFNRVYSESFWTIHHNNFRSQTSNKCRQSLCWNMYCCTNSNDDMSCWFGWTCSTCTLGKKSKRYSRIIVNNCNKSSWIQDQSCQKICYIFLLHPISI